VRRYIHDNLCYRFVMLPDGAAAYAVETAIKSGEWKHGRPFLNPGRWKWRPPSIISKDFIRKRMRMSHIYQPVMIKELLTSGGKSSIRNIAAAFLARDASQLEYYEQITKDMPGKVLAKHGIE
jgi:hypothetical protein